MVLVLCAKDKKRRKLLRGELYFSRVKAEKVKENFLPA